jgi:rRNA biogenesis protein RRP5
VTKKSSEPVSAGPNLRDICDEFEKRLVGQPNSSFLWIQYMSALLRASEPDAARSTAERALTTIRFRDVQEKLNVWIAFLNLERAVGTADSLKKVFERACVYNEPKHVHIQLAKIYEATRRPDEEQDDPALALHRTMCKKFSQSCKVWVGHMLYLYTAGQDETAARKLLPQALKSLPRRKHVKITCKAAQLEYKYGSAERARTLFEGVLANAPKRVDIWSVYLTMEENRLASAPENIDHVRRLFERIVHLRMSSKKAKYFFKRFLDFEKAHGTEEGVEHVKELARTYVETNMAH